MRTAVGAWVRAHARGATCWMRRAMAEDDAGTVPSSSRIIGFVLVWCATVLTLVTAYYVLFLVTHARATDAATIAALGGAIASVLGGLAYVMGKRTGQ